MTGTPDFAGDGLVPAIAQDARTGAVLMLAYMNEDAYRRTRETGFAHFWSRSRQELWKKGATSGNVLSVIDIALDCDSDAVLLTVEPAGPACHTGASACFDASRHQLDDADADHGTRPPAAGGLQGFFDLESLWATIADRADRLPEGSYTAELIAGGVDATARKVLEEATEVVLAAKNHAVGKESRDRVASEAADVVYHLLVLLAERGISPQFVLDELAGRAPGADR